MTAPHIFSPEYYERMRELESTSWWSAGMRDAAERLLDLARLPSSGTALDVGCGSGQTMRWFRTLRPGWSVRGFDLAREGLTAARELGESGVFTASALNIPLRDASVDLVFTLDVLQHLPLGGGDTAALGEMRRILRLGGSLLVRTNAQSIPWTPDDPAHDFHKYETPELNQRLRGAGFTPIRIGKMNSLLGLGEIPRELWAHWRSGRVYHGILAHPPSRPGVLSRMLRAWLRMEGRAVARGWSLPVGRTILALCR